MASWRLYLFQSPFRFLWRKTAQWPLVCGIGVQVQRRSTRTPGEVRADGCRLLLPSVAESDENEFPTALHFTRRLASRRSSRVTRKGIVRIRARLFKIGPVFHR